MCLLRRYFPNWLPPLPVPNGHSGTMSVNLNTHNKLLLMAPAYDRHGTVGFRCVADAPGSPPPAPPTPPVGCASGVCAAFCDNAAVQGCAAILPGSNVSMRAPPTGMACGGVLGQCAAPADACAAGWALCLSNFSDAALGADGFRANMAPETCATGALGRFIAAMSHANCPTCPNAPTSADAGCQATGCGSEAICCGSGCVLAGCGNLWQNGTSIYVNEAHGCGNVVDSVANGVLCCKL